MGELNYKVGDFVSAKDMRFFRRCQKADRLKLDFSFCENCGLVTKELFEEPINSKRKPFMLCCKDCRCSSFSNIDKGKIIDMVARREANIMRYGVKSVILPEETL